MRSHNPAAAILAAIEASGCLAASDLDRLIERLLPRQAASKRRLARRGEALCKLAATLEPGASACAAAGAVEAALHRYASSRWRADAARADCPQGYIGTQREHWFVAMQAGGGKVLSARRIRFVLSRRWPSIAVVTANVSCDAHEEEEQNV